MTDLEIAPRQARGPDELVYKGGGLEKWQRRFSNPPPPSTTTPVVELAETRNVA